MIESTFLPYLTTIFPIVCAITLLVLRAGASRVFFDIVGTYQADRLIKDQDAALTVYESLYLDTFNGIQEAAQEIGDQFTDLVDFVRPLTEEIEEARIQLEKFLDMAESDMKAVQQEVIDVGQAFAFAADEAMLAGAKMAQLSGVLGPSSIGVGTEIGMMFGLISGMETDAAMQRMVNLNQQTKFMTQGIEENMSATEQATRIRINSIRVLDELNTVENRSVATMEQITFVMNQFASQAKLTNESIAAMAALSATLIEAGEEQGKGGRALRMMYARLGADINGSRKAVEDLGIAVADSEGNMRAFTDVLVDLAAAYHTMSGEEQTSLAQTVAGNRHYTRLIKLLENVDRVKELEFEATIAMFPAMDEIERRRKTELFLLQEAESAYKTQVGILGNQLLPTLTSVTERQTVFLKQVNALADSPLGGIITVPLFFAQSAKAFMGPALQMILSLQNMNIALRTQSAITRALNGEKVAGMGYDRMTGNFNTKEVERKRALNARMKEELVLRERLNRESKVRLRDPSYKDTAFQKIDKINEALRDNALAHTEVRRQMATSVGITKMYEDRKESLSAKEKKIFNEAVDRRNKEMAQLRELEAQRREMHEQKKIHTMEIEYILDREIAIDQLKHDVEQRQMKQKAQSFNKLTIQMGALGGAMMMIGGKNAKVMRAGMALSSAAMAFQTVKVIANTYANLTNMFSTKLLTDEERKRAIQLGILNELEAQATRRTLTLATARGALATASSKVAKVGKFLLNPWVGAALTIASVAAAIYKFRKASKEVTESIKQEQIELNDVMLDSAMVLTMLKDKELDVNKTIEEKTALINSLKDSEDELIKTRVEGLKEELKALKQTKDIREFEAEQLTGEAGRNYFKLMDEQNRLYDKFGKNGVGIYGIDDDAIHKAGNRLKSVLPFQEDYHDQIRKAEKDVKNYRKENVQLINFIEKHGINSYEELTIMAEQYGKSINDLINDTNREESALDNLGTQYSAITDQLKTFSDTREEMFYGFDRNNLTGDLVRQVTQQGVETLVTTTEVIMTNNFNGMTVPEVADMIIEEIENRGNLRGYNLSTA